MENNPEAETAEDLEEIDLGPTEEVINNLPDNSRGYLIPTLDKIQNIYRYLPEPTMEMLMEFFGISRAEIYGVISFYPQLRITEPGKYIIKLCYGTACFVKGATIINDKIHEKYNTYDFLIIFLTCCFGSTKWPSFPVPENTYLSPFAFLTRCLMMSNK